MKLLLVVLVAHLFAVGFSQILTNPVCRLPLDRGGLCLPVLPRYHFNCVTGLCERFHFKNCGGNANNFRTLAACKATCNPRWNLCEPKDVYLDEFN